MTAKRKPIAHTLSAALLLFVLLTVPALTATAQQFAVKGFRTLPNDVSAFISPVRDLNGDACALLKVIAPREFDFASPLGIVSRRDEVGEIWLYLPKGSRRLTLKHPRWGVLRDYRFAAPLESHVTYELSLNIPQQPDSIKRDTVVLTRTVRDTVTVGTTRHRPPLTMGAALTASVHTNGPSWGLMLFAMRRHGAFIHASTDLRSIGDTRMECDEAGYVDQSGILPYYTGSGRHSSFAVTAGPVHRLWRGVNLFYGAGYGRTATAWQLDDSEGGGYALNNGLTHSGLAAEAGVALSFGHFCITASAVTIGGRHWQGCVGIGVALFKGKKVKK